MRYLRNTNNGVVIYPYTPTDLIRSESNTSFPRELTDELLSEYGVLPVVEVQAPPFNANTEAVEEGVELISGVWTQKWLVRTLTAAELKSRVPFTVSMRQARRALLAAGLLAQVDAAIAGLSGVDGDAARIDWEFAQEVPRDSQLVIAISQQLNLTEADLDDL